MAKLIDDKDQWIAGCATLVQTGDRVDRHHESLKVIDFLNKLAKDAPKFGGGKVIQLVGNHEALNMGSHNEYVHPQEIESKGGEAAWRNLFSRRGVYGQQLRKMPLVYVDEESKTVFVHGGLTPKWAKLGVEKINRMALQHMQSDKFDTPDSIFRDDGPVWDRSVITEASGKDPFGRPNAKKQKKNSNNNNLKNQNDGDDDGAGANDQGGIGVEDQDNDDDHNDVKDKQNYMKKNNKSHHQCPLLEQSLQLLGGMTRMVVGHTPQMGGKIGMFCDKRLIAADVGISKSMMNQLAAVEILGDDKDGDVIALYGA